MAESATVDELHFQLIHGSQKYAVTLVASQDDHELTVADLAMEVERVSQVPVANQKLISKGKSLADPSATVKSAGLKNNAKVMLIGKKFNPEEEEYMKMMQKVVSDSQKVEKKLQEMADETDGIQKGFVSRSHQAESLPRLERRVSECGEEFTRLLERLDTLQLADSGPEVKVKRKSLINRIQVSLKRCDDLQCDLRDLQSKLASLDQS